MQVRRSWRPSGAACSIETLRRGRNRGEVGQQGCGGLEYNTRHSGLPGALRVIPAFRVKEKLLLPQQRKALLRAYASLLRDVGRPGAADQAEGTYFRHLTSSGKV